jgi:hypothetical protein
VNASLILKMSVIVSGVLKLTLGILAKKIRSRFATRLKHGDVMNEVCRGWILRELDDIKNRLDGLSRKDLKSSFCFLQEGVTALSESVRPLDSNEATAESAEQATSVEAASSRDTGPDSPINEAVALIDVIESSKIRYSKRFEQAVESLKRAREKATDAFSNDSLPVEDRIQASQIRMMARILECLDNPDASVRDCMQYLKQLHDIGDIRGIFSVLIDGGVRSPFKKTRRLNNASSVHVMNQMLFDFAKKFTKLPQNIFEWPMILFGKIRYHPLHGHFRLNEKLKESTDVQVMSVNPDFTFGEDIHYEISVVNSKGEILALTRSDRTFKIFKPVGESRTLCEIPKDDHTSNYFVTAIDIDTQDNIYVITASQEGCDRSRSFKLFMFDENGIKKLESPLPFLQSKFGLVRMAINTDGKIAILNCKNKTVYIGNVCVEVNSFKVDNSFHLNKLQGHPVGLRFHSDLNGTKIIAADSATLFICTENGKLEHKIKIDQKIRSFVINDHDVTKRFLVKPPHDASGCSVLRFSETGKLEDSLWLGSTKWVTDAELTSHPNGRVALVGKTGATLL